MAENTHVPGNAEPQLGNPGRAELGLGVPREHGAVPKGWYSRGYLPHRDHPGLLQAITYRLADSLPAELLAGLEDELRLAEPLSGRPGARRSQEHLDSERRKRIETWLDAGHGCCILRDPRAAACVVETWRHFSRVRYDLIAWVVMANHVHVLIRAYDGVALGKIVQSWKSYTARQIGLWMAEPPGNAEPQLGSSPANAGQRVGPRRSQGIWMRDYWDRYIRNESHFAAAVNYIHENPVKAGLVSRAEDWPWSSARETGDR